MFDFAWSEIALIGVVALVLIGPKDMPVAIKAVSDMVKKARKMASELQGHVDEMVKDTSIAEVRQQINEIRNFDIRGEVERAVDADGSLRSAFADDPLRSGSSTAMGEVHVAPPGVHSVARPPEVAAVVAPAFIPPATTPPPQVAVAPPPPAPPAFVPPGADPPA
jgi:sec-independent protein translocase protein TatB